MNKPTKKYLTLVAIGICCIFSHTKQWFAKPAKEVELGNSSYIEQAAKDKSRDPMIFLLNKERSRENLQELKYNNLLYQSAKAKSCHMLENGYFAHVSPEGIDGWYFFNQTKYHYEYAGENLAVDFQSDELTMNAFMSSKTHKENILGEDFTEIGIGRCGGYITLHFGKPK